MTHDSPNSDIKISRALLEFAEPLWKDPEDPPSTEDFKRALDVACLIWNAVTIDALLGGRECVSFLYEAGEADPMFSRIADLMVERKLTQFGQDLRIIFGFQVRTGDGEWHVDAQGMSFQPRTPGERLSPEHKAALHERKDLLREALTSRQS